MLVGKRLATFKLCIMLEDACRCCSGLGMIPISEKLGKKKCFHPGAGYFEIGKKRCWTVRLNGGGI